MRRLAGLLAASALLAIPAAAAGAENPWLGRRVVDFAHQGGEDELPSNTLFAYREALERGADMLEIDVGATKDGRLVVLHDNTLDRTTNGTGSIGDRTLAEIQALDAAYWFVPGRGAVRDAPATAYRWRGVRRGHKRAPAGYTREDFRVPSLEDVLQAFPTVPMNIEIKGRDGSDAAVYLRGAELLARALTKARRRDVIVASFEQQAIDRFHALAPQVPVSPGIDGAAAFILGGASPGPGVQAFQVPITFRFGDQLLTITTPDFVARAHEAGYAVHVWLSNDSEDAATYRRLVAMCVDGIMAAKVSLLERTLRAGRVAGPGRPRGEDPCGTRVAGSEATADGRTVTVPLRRRGLSPERRAGRVVLYRSERGVRHGERMGAGTFTLAHGAPATTAAVALNDTGAAAVRAGAPLALRAEVYEHALTPAGAGALTVRRQARR